MRRWLRLPRRFVRGVHVAMVLFLSFLVFPPTKKRLGSIAWYDICLALLGVSAIVYMLVDFEAFIYRAVTPNAWGPLLRQRPDHTHIGGHAARHGLDRACRCDGFPHLRLHRPHFAASLDAPGLHPQAHHRPYVHDAGGHLRRARRCVIDVHHTLYHLRGGPRAFQGGQVFYRLFIPADGRQAHFGRQDSNDGLVPSGRAFGQRRSNYRDARLGRLSDAQGGGLRQGIRRRSALRRRHRRNHLAARPRRSRLPHRRDTEGLLPPGHQDGDGADDPLLLVDLR